MTQVQAFPGDIIQIVLQRSLAPAGAISFPEIAAGVLPTISDYGRFYRIVVMVKEIIDSRVFTGVWRGQVIKCLSFPDTSTLTVGSPVIVTRLERSTEYFAWSGAAEELYFTPGANVADAYKGELWKLAGATPALVLQVGPDEYITHLFWSNIAPAALYMCTEEFTLNGKARIYLIDRTAGTATEVVSWTGGTGANQEANPVVDSAQFGSYIYTFSGAYYSPGVVRRFDPVGLTWTTVLNFRADMGSIGFGGGIAVDPVAGSPCLVASDGANAYYSTDGTTWVFDQDLTVFNSTDNLSLFTHRQGDDLIYGSQQFGAGAADPDAIVRNSLSNWASDLVDGLNDDGIVAFTQEFTGPTVTALWAQRANFNFIGGGCAIWRKPVGGAWAQDWAGPPTNPTYYFGSYSQGLAWFGGKIFALFTGQDPMSLNPRNSLWRRDALNTWVQVQAWDYQYPQTFYPAMGMAVAPRTAWLCQEA